MSKSKAQIARRLVELGVPKSFNTLRGYDLQTLCAMADQLEREMEEALREVQREQAEALLYEAADATMPDIALPPQSAADAILVRPMGCLEAERMSTKQAEPIPLSSQTHWGVDQGVTLPSPKAARRPATWGELVAAPFLFVFGLLRL